MLQLWLYIPRVYSLAHDNLIYVQQNIQKRGFNAINSLQLKIS